MLRALIITWALFFAQNTLADLDPKTLAVLAELQPANNDADLLKIAAGFTALREDPVLMRDAVAISRSKLRDEPAGRTAIIRLLRLSLVLRSKGKKGEAPEWMDMEESIDTLTRNDLAALRRATGFPQLGDSINYLFDRKLSLRQVPESGEYTVIRMISDTGETVILERNTVPFMDLGPEWTQRTVSSDTDSVQTQDSERAQTRRFWVKSLPNLVLAAKAFRIAELSKTTLEGYAAYVASEAIADGLSGLGFKAGEGGQIGFSVWGIRQSTLNILEGYPGDSFLVEMSKQIRVNLPATAFSARAFLEAAEFYRSASGTSPERQLWSAWGEGISNYAAHEFEKANEAFNRMRGLFPHAKNAASYAYVFRSFYDNLPEKDRKALGELSSVAEAAYKKLSSTELSLEQRVSLDKDFANIMVTIGRSYIAIPHIIDRLSALDEKSGVGLKGVETRYLWELGALTRDIYYDISWVMSPSLGWVARPTESYPMQLDFLHNVNSDGQLVAPGEVVIHESGTPYGMLSPEEDLATSVAVYGVIEHSSTSAGILQATPVKQKNRATLGFGGWAINARDRKNPKPSIVPLLKLVWVEWFAQQFEPLKTGLSAKDFIYRPKNYSGLTDLQQVAALGQHRATTSQQRELIDLFLSVRRLLEQRYNYAYKEGK
ncbi:hypothetical protein [Desulfogranum marinum]|uniref:hypothetical protein n=1 Tax=Desulfogranum marinum TaxID=453220 RepID=UPI0029C8455E|nr:hypothetical protein [Desulfogranum marinum]